MNVCRWLGISLFLLGAVCLIGTTKFPVFAGIQDKDKKEVKKEAKEDKKETPKADKKEDKKEDKKQEEKKADPAAKDDGKKGDILAFKAFEGKPFFQEQVTETTQKMDVMGQSVTQKQKQTFIIQWSPKDKNKDGDYVVEQSIVGVKMDIDIGGTKIAYDSTAKNPKNPMTDFFEQLTKQKLTFTIGADLKVKSVGGREDFIKGLNDINPQMGGLLKAILSEQALQKMAEPTWWAFPTGGVIPPGNSWKRESDLDLGPIGNYKTIFDFTAKQPEGAKVKIGIKTSLTYSAPTKNQGLPFIIHKADLKSESGEGEAIFDREKGRFDTSKINMKLAGDLTIEVGNMQTTVKLNQQQEATSRTLDENPWEKKGG